MEIDNNNNLPSYRDFMENPDNLPSVEELKEDNLPSVEEFLEKTVEEETQTIENSDGESFLEVTDVVQAPEWSELVRLVNDVRKDIPKIPEIRYYDEQLEVISANIAQIQDNYAKSEKIDVLNVQNEEFEGKLTEYNQDIDSIRDKITDIGEEIKNLPEVKDDLESLKSKIESVSKSIPSLPHWIEEVHEVPDFSWISRSFHHIDDDFGKVQGHIDIIKDKIDREVSNLNETLEVKEFEFKVDVKNLNDNLDQTNNRITETKDKIYQEIKESSIRVWELHNTFKDDDKKLKKSILSEQNKLKQSLEGQIKKINEQSVKADESILNFFTDLKETVDALPEVKYYDKDVSRIDKDVLRIDKDILFVRNELKELSKLASLIKTEQTELKENYLLNEPPEEQQKSGDNVDPLTPLNQNFATLDDLSNHYRLFLNRINTQLATIGGGGIEDAPKTGGPYSRQGQRWIGGQISTTGVSTSFGIHIDPVGSGVTYSEDLVVIGDARVTGILSIGTSSIILDANSKSIGGITQLKIGAADSSLNPIILKQAPKGHKDEGKIKFVKTQKDADGNDIETDDDVSVGIGTTVSVLTTGIITAASFGGSGKNLTHLTGATSGTYGDANSTPVIVVDTNGRITGISTVTTAGSGGGSSIAGIDTTGTSYFNNINASGTISANSFSGITTSMISDYGNGLSGGGSGINAIGIQSAGVLVGTAKTINFGSGVTIANDVASVSVGSTTRFVGARIYHDNFTPAGTNATFEVQNWDGTSLDTHSFVDSSHGFTIPAGVSKVRLIVGARASTGSVANQWFIFKNGSSLKTIDGGFFVESEANTGYNNSSVSGVTGTISVTEGDTFDLRYYLNSTTPTWDIFFEIEVIEGDVLGTYFSATNIVDDTSPQLGGNLDLNSKDITGTGNLNITGVATFSGNVTIGGTLTYEDVTNVDSVGLITARNGINVSSNGINVTGVSTFQSHVELGDDDELRLGDNKDLRLYHDGSNSYVADNGSGSLILASTFGGVLIRKHNVSETMAGFNPDSSVDLYYNGTKKFETVGYGVTVYGTTETQELNVTGIATADAFSGFDYLKAPHGTTVNYAVTVDSKTAAHRYNGSGSSNGYLIDGVESPFLTFTPGRTYRFTLSSSDMTSHPFRFYLEADKTTSYTTNVTSTSTYTEIVVTDTTPTVLHYQCSAHEYMGNAVQVNSNKVNTPYQIDGLNGANITGDIISSGKLLVGTETEGAALADNLTVADTGNCGITIRSGTTSYGSIYFSDATSGSDEYRGQIEYNHNTDSLRIYSGGTAVLRIDPGKLEVIGHTETDTLNVSGVVTATSIVKSGGTSSQYLMADGSVSTGGGSSNSFETIAVSGQSDVVADSATDTLTLVAGSNMTITTNASGDSITFASSGGGGGGGGSIGIRSDGTVIQSSASNLNFIGAGITMADDGSVTDITIPTISRTSTRIVATDGQTAFTVAEYDSSLIDVYLNGVKLDSTEYTTTNSTTITLTTGASTGDIFESVSYSNFAGTTHRNLPQNAQTSAYTLVASDTGKHISITTGGVTVPSGIFSVGDIVTIYNNSSSSQTITQGASVTLRQAGTSNTGNRSLDQYGTSTLLCVASNVFVISGSGLG